MQNYKAPTTLDEEVINTDEFQVDEWAGFPSETKIEIDEPSFEQENIEVETLDEVSVNDEAPSSAEKKIKSKKDKKGKKAKKIEPDLFQYNDLIEDEVPEYRRTVNDLIKEFEYISRLSHFPFYKVFEDFCELSTCALHNRFMNNEFLQLSCYHKVHEAKEKKYFEILPNMKSQLLNILQHY